MFRINGLYTFTLLLCACFFFFQAEDGIRDGHVTGVQTCALPISPFGTAEREPGQRVLEDLFEAQELHDPDVDRRVEAQTSLVGAQRRAELHPETAVDLDLAVVIDPWHSEDDLPLRLAQPGQHTVVRDLVAPVKQRGKAVDDLRDGLDELVLAAVPMQYVPIDGLQARVHHAPSPRREYRTIDLGTRGQTPLGAGDRKSVV